jgi:hypothetical protein
VFTETVDTAVNSIKTSWRNQLLRDAINKQHQVLSSIDHDNPDNESILECIHTLSLLTQATTAVDSCINTLRTNTERFLWHQRLGHPSDSYLYNAHKYIDGVPQFKHSDPVMDYCPVCTRSEQPKTHGGGTTMKATCPWQGLSVDFAFTGQSRKDKNKYEDYLGLHGETCWILFKDHFTGLVVGENALYQKLPPSTSFEIFFKSTFQVMVMVLIDMSIWIKVENSIAILKYVPSFVVVVSRFIPPVPMVVIKMVQ